MDKNNNKKVDVAAIRDYLISKRADADADLSGSIRALVAEGGGLFSNGSMMVYDTIAKRFVVIAWPKSTCDLLALVKQTAEPVMQGGQGSGALIDMLNNVAIRLYTIATRESETIKANTSMVKMIVGRGEETDEVGSATCVYTDPSGVETAYTPATLKVNLSGLTPSCVRKSWFQSIALRPEIGDSMTFDQLNGTIRCGTNTIVCTPDADADADGAYTLHMRPFESDDHLLLDAGHEVTGIDLTSLAKLPEVVDVRDMMEDWVGELVDFLFVSLAERLFLCQPRKEAHIFEVCSDRGKSTMIDVIEMAMGSYARRLPNAAVSGDNMRTVRVAEATLSRAGVRFMLHDEVDKVDWLYLKEQSNGTQSEEYDVGMANRITANHKAMRIITRNATRPDLKATAAPRDCRHKIVLWSGTTLHKPTANAERYDRIKNRDPVTARGVFLAVLEAFQRLGGKRPIMPSELLAGSDLAPTPTTAETDDVARAEAIASLAARRVYHRLYRPSTMAEGGTASKDIQDAICTAFGPSMFSNIPLLVFNSRILQAGRAVPGDADQVPMVHAKSYIGPQEDDTSGQKRLRTGNVIMCLPR